MSNETRNGLRRYLLGAAASLTCALVLQSGALLWWAGSINARVANMERLIDQVSQRVHTLEVAKQ